MTYCRKKNYLQIIIYHILFEGLSTFIFTLLAVRELTMTITATMARDITSDGLDPGLVDPTGLGPITAGLLVGPQAAVTGVALPLQAPEQPQVSLFLRKR